MRNVKDATVQPNYRVFFQKTFAKTYTFPIYPSKSFPYHGILSSPCCLFLIGFLVDFVDFDSMVFFALLLQIVWQHEGCEGCNCATQLYFISADSDIDFL